MDYTRILIDIDTSLRHLNDSIQQASELQRKPQSKADFIREIAPKIALTIAPSAKANFPSVIQLAARWYDEIEEYVSGMDTQTKPTNTTAGYMSGGYYYELKKFEEETGEPSQHPH